MTVMKHGRRRWVGDCFVSVFKREMGLDVRGDASRSFSAITIPNRRLALLALSYTMNLSQIWLTILLFQKGWAHGKFGGSEPRDLN